MTATITLDEDQRDCLQEVTNVAMGQAADRLARLLDTFVVLPIPHIDVVAPGEIAMAVQAIDSCDNILGVCQGFIGGGIAGEAILLFNETSFHDLAALLKYDDEMDAQAERELLMDTTNVLFGACIKSIAEQIDMTFSFGPPMVLSQYDRIDQLFDPKRATWKQALVMEIHYKLENFNVNCDLLLIVTEDSIDLLLKKLDYLIS